MICFKIAPKREKEKEQDKQDRQDKRGIFILLLKIA